MVDPGPAQPAAARHLDNAQRAVIARSRRHGLASVGAARSNWWSRTRPLADPRHEALRRYVVLLRNGGDDWASEAAAMLVRLGYSIDQVAHARWLVASETEGEPRDLPFAATFVGVKAALLTVMLVAQASPAWPLALVAGVVATIVAIPRPESRRVAWERNFTVV